MQQFIDFSSTVAYFTWEPVTPLQESDVVELAAFLNVRLEQIVDDVLAHSTNLATERVTSFLILSGGSTLNLTENLVPLVLQHVDLAALGSHLVPHGNLNFRDLHHI